MIEEHFQRVVDEHEAIQCLARFHQAVDGGKWNVLHKAVLTEDATWTWIASFAHGPQKDTIVHDTAEGRDAVVAWLKSAVGMATPRHMTTNHQFTRSADGLKSSSYMLVTDRSTLDVIASGVITADYIRSGDDWRIKRLRVEERIANREVAVDR